MDNLMRYGRLALKQVMKTPKSWLIVCINFNYLKNVLTFFFKALLIQLRNVARNKVKTYAALYIITWSDVETFL
jgi:hypothetical protein